MTPGERLAAELGARVGDVAGTKLSPMLCGRDESGERILLEPGWIFELKLDGVRILADKRGDDVKLGYRKGRGATDSYPEIAEAVRALREHRLVLDGEVVATDDEGRPDFQKLGTRIQSRGRRGARAAASVPVVYVVFDILAIGDRDLTRLPIEARKAILERVLSHATAADGRILLHPTFADGKELFRMCRERHLEGVVAKRALSAYRPNDRSQDWVKIKCEEDVDLVVVAWTAGEGRRAHFGALDVAAYEAGRLVVRGSVGSGLDEATIEVLLDRLRPIEVGAPVAEGKYRPKKSRHHVKPEVVVSVRHLGLSEDGYLRFPVFRGVRHDLRPEDCTRDAAPAARRVAIHAPSLVVLPDGTTKGELCAYYERVAPVLLPYLDGRISSFVRAVLDGDAAKRQVLWPLPSWAPSWIRTHAVKVIDEEVRGVLVGDVDALLFGIEAGAASVAMSAILPSHGSASPSADFIALRIAGHRPVHLARRARELAESAGLPAFVKIAVSPDHAVGFDVLVPVGVAPPEGARVLAALFARLLARDADASGCRVAALDAPIAPYAIDLPMGAGRGAVVSLPIAWDELDGFHVLSATPAGVLARLERGLPDPMAELSSARIDFAQAVAAVEGIVTAAGDSGGDSLGPSGRAR